MYVWMMIETTVVCVYTRDDRYLYLCYHHLFTYIYIDDDSISTSMSSVKSLLSSVIQMYCVSMLMSGASVMLIIDDDEVDDNDKIDEVAANLQLYLFIDV